MTPGNLIFQSPQSGSDGRGSRTGAMETTARALTTRRSSVIAPELSRGACRVAMAKEQQCFDTRAVNLAIADTHNPFNVYPAAVPGPLGFFLTALSVGVLVAGNAVAASVLIGWL